MRRNKSHSCRDARQKGVPTPEDTCQTNIIAKDLYGDKVRLRNDKVKIECLEKRVKSRVWLFVTLFEASAYDSKRVQHN